MKPGDLCLTCSDEEFDLRYFRSKIIVGLRVPKEFILEDGKDRCELNIPCVILGPAAENQWYVLIDEKVKVRNASELIQQEVVSESQSR